MIKLITGLPGAGKSLTAVELLAAEAKSENRRPIFACGIDGLDASLAEVIHDPLEWESLPDGSLVVVDEAQKYFPARRMSEPVPPVKALSEHRHRGFDFILLTQHPNMIDSYVRRLVGEHVHVVRRFGLQIVDKYTWNECVDDLQSESMRGRATKSTVRYNKSLFGAYKSATVHTVKRRWPLALKLLPFVIVAAVALLWWSYRLLMAPTAGKSAQTTSVPEKQKRAVGSSDGGIFGSQDARRQPRYRDAGEYAAAHTARIAGMPWTAPVFDERRVSADPDILCVEIEKKCKCYTEQITPIAMEMKQCRRIARDGIYNPYRQQRREVAEERDEDRAQKVRRESVDVRPTARLVPESNAGYGSPGAPAAPASAWVLGAPRPDQ